VFQRLKLKCDEPPFKLCFQFQIVPLWTGWASLRKKPNTDKKLAITVFSFPPDKGNVGTAAYLNVFGSIFRVLQNLKAEGYNIGDCPATEEELINSVLNDKVVPRRYDKVPETTWTLKLSSESSRSIHQNGPFGRLSTTCCQVLKWFHAHPHIAGHVADRRY